MSRFGNDKPEKAPPRDKSNERIQMALKGGKNAT
jgi:hypothetical protein